MLRYRLLQHTWHDTQLAASYEDVTALSFSSQHPFGSIFPQCLPSQCSLACTVTTSLSLGEWNHPVGVRVHPVWESSTDLDLIPWFRPVEQRPGTEPGLCRGVWVIYLYTTLIHSCCSFKQRHTALIYQSFQTLVCVHGNAATQAHPTPSVCC